MRIGVEHRIIEMQAPQVQAHDLHEFRHRFADMAEGEIHEGTADPAQRVEHVHRLSSEPPVRFHSAASSAFQIRNPESKMDMWAEWARTNEPAIELISRSYWT